MEAKKFIKDVIGSYEEYMKLLKKKGKEKESAKICGMIFGLREGYNLFDIQAIKNIVDLGKETYVKQENDFECGKIEGLFTVYKILKGESLQSIEMLIGLIDIYKKIAG